MTNTQTRREKTLLKFVEAIAEDTGYARLATGARQRLTLDILKDVFTLGYRTAYHNSRKSRSQFITTKKMPKSVKKALKTVRKAEKEATVEQLNPTLVTVDKINVPA